MEKGGHLHKARSMAYNKSKASCLLFIADRTVGWSALKFSS